MKNIKNELEELIYEEFGSTLDAKDEEIENKDKTIAIDGKTICSTDQRTKDGQPLHILSAIESESKLIIGSLPCDSKISEPKIFRKLVDILDISGAMLVADALHCQKESAADADLRRCAEKRTENRSF